MARGNKYIYLAAANDKYDTPLYVTDSAREMADFLHCSLDSLHSRISKERHGKRPDRKATAVKVFSYLKEDDDD